MGALDEAADGLLAARAADGDEVAFAVIVRRHLPYLRAFATQLLRSSAEADDVVQDALISAWEHLPALRDPATLRGWLSTIVARKATDRLRSARPTTPIDELELADRADGPADRAELSSGMRELSRAISELPDDVRVVWVLRESSGVSYEDIAARLGVPVSTVRGRLARARAQLLEHMMEWSTA